MKFLRTLFNVLNSRNYFEREFSAHEAVFVQALAARDILKRYDPTLHWDNPILHAASRMTLLVEEMPSKMREPYVGRCFELLERAFEDKKISATDMIWKMKPFLDILPDEHKKQYFDRIFGHLEANCHVVTDDLNHFKFHEMREFIMQYLSPDDYDPYVERIFATIDRFMESGEISDDMALKEINDTLESIRRSIRIKNDYKFDLESVGQKINDVIFVQSLLGPCASQRFVFRMQDNGVVKAEMRPEFRHGLEVKNIPSSLPPLDGPGSVQ
jgi:hypothetical protein